LKGNYFCIFISLEIVVFLSFFTINLFGTLYIGFYRFFRFMQIGFLPLINTEYVLFFREGIYRLF